MITLDLKARFSELARSDHLQRVEAVLIELDLGYGYSLLPDFKQRIAVCSSQLEALRFYSAYQQTCVLFCVFIQCISIEFLLKLKCNGAAWNTCLSLAFERGVSLSFFEQIHFKLAGISRLDEAWIVPFGEPDKLHGSNSSKQFPSLLQLACGHEGPLGQGTQLVMDNTANFFRTESGFQHTLVGNFTPLELLKHVCHFHLPKDSSILSLHPLVERCELGKLGDNQFDCLQRIELIDARKVQTKFAMRSFDCSDIELLQLERCWSAVDFLIEPQIQLQKPLVMCSLELVAGWQQYDENFKFKIQGNACIEIPQAAIQWSASLVHDGVLVHLVLQSDQHLRVEWNLDETWIQGQFPVGTDCLVREITVPLTVSCSSVVTVGQPMLSAVESFAGLLQVSLIGILNSESHQLELNLAIRHSDLSCDWQFADVLRGHVSGTWSFLRQAPVARWNLLRG